MLKLKTDKPLAIFDIEATGTNPRVDRIIDLAIVKLLPDGKRETSQFRINPERPIPPEASAIHGILDADVAHSPTFKQKAAEIDRIFAGCDLGGYNLLHYDIPMITEEMLRAGIDFSIDGRRIIDAQRVYHKREPRDLSAALAFYCHEMHLGAHGALDDVNATIRVMEGQFERYRDLPQGIDELHAYCNPSDPTWVDRTGKLKWTDNEIVINFGRNQGRKLRDLARMEPNFLKWMLGKNFPQDTMVIVKNALEGRFPAPPGSLSV